MYITEVAMVVLLPTSAGREFQSNLGYYSFLLATPVVF